MPTSSTSYVLGLNGQLLYGEATGTTAPSTELANVKDVTISIECGEADVTTRAAQGWRASAPTLKSATLEFTMLWNPDDAGFATIQSAFFGGTAVRFLASDGNGEGLQADFVITSFSRSEPLEEAMTVSVTAKPTNSSIPTWVTPA